MLDQESAGSIDRVIKSVFDTARSQVETLSTGMVLAWAELRLVASRAGLLVGLLFVAVGMVLVTWILVLVTGAFMLVDIGFSPVQSLLIMLSAQAFGLFLVLFLIRHILKGITFTHTRRAMSSTQTQTGFDYDDAPQST